MVGTVGRLQMASTGDTAAALQCFYTSCRWRMTELKSKHSNYSQCASRLFTGVPDVSEATSC